LVTGANGFIGKNLVVRLGELHQFSVAEFVRGDAPESLSALLTQADAVVHLAGETRPADEAAFAQVNTGLTVALCNALAAEHQRSGRQLPVLLASSAQAERDNPYGHSKLAAEQAVQALCEATGHPAVVYRLPGVFGKWCKPNYNSLVATFCHN
jgi:UDP-2-acetamido-2,6-beta-L-arabino-hexul-4-ose reductase